MSSFVLLFSSLTMAMAVGAIHRGDERRCRTFLLDRAARRCSSPARSTSSTSFVKENLGYTTSIFAPAFYTLTGFHGVHVSVGIIFLLSLFVMSVRGNLGSDRGGRSRS